MRTSIVLAVGVTVAMIAPPTFAAEPTKDECIAASEDGQDLRRVGKISAATKRFATCSSESCPAPVRADCEKRGQEAERAQPTVRFVTRDSRGQAVRDATVRVDDAVIASTLGDGAILVDAGAHRFEFAGRGGGKLTKTFDIVEGVKGREEVIVLESTAAPGAGDESGVLHGAPHRTLAYGAGAAGALLLVVGGITGLLAKSKYDDAVGSCDKPVNGTRLCEGGGIKAGDSANTLATLSTAAFIAGGVLAATSVVLFAIAPPRRSLTSTSPPRRLAVAVGAASVQLSGAW